MATAHKKVIVRRFFGDVLSGYLPASGFVQGTQLSLLDLDGRIQPVPLREIKCVFFVRDFNLGDSSNPERLMRRSFLARPRTDGLWLRLAFRETGDILEGLAPTDATLLHDLTEDAGFQIAPPDTRSNTQRIYIPRLSIASLELLAVVTSATKRRQSMSPGRGVDVEQLQKPLFSDLKNQLSENQPADRGSA